MKNITLIYSFGLQMPKRLIFTSVKMCHTKFSSLSSARAQPLDHSSASVKCERRWMRNELIYFFIHKLSYLYGQCTQQTLHMMSFVSFSPLQKKNTFLFFVFFKDIKKNYFSLCMKIKIKEPQKMIFGNMNHRT